MNNNQAGSPFPMGAKVRYKDDPDFVNTVRTCQRITVGGPPWWQVWYEEGGFDDSEILELVPDEPPFDIPILKGILLDVEREMDDGGYGMFKEYRKEVFVRFLTAIKGEDNE